MRNRRSKPAPGFHPSEPAKPGADGQLVEHEYERKGALCYFAAWDVRLARLFDRCDDKDGIVASDRLIEQFTSQEPYRSANRVFVVVDNGSAHRGQASIGRLRGRYYDARQISRCLFGSQRVLNERRLEVVAHDLGGGCP
jgi:hypothetical protein